MVSRRGSFNRSLEKRFINIRYYNGKYNPDEGDWIIQDMFQPGKVRGLLQYANEFLEGLGPTFTEPKAILIMHYTVDTCPIQKGDFIEVEPDEYYIVQGVRAYRHPYDTSYSIMYAVV